MPSIQHFVVTPTGLVLRLKTAYAAEQYAATVEGGLVATDHPETGLANLPMPVLITLYNTIRPEKPVTRFADRKTAETRLKGVLDALSRPAPAPVEEPAEEAPADDSETPNDATPSDSQEEDDMATKSARKRAPAAKKTAAKKTTGTRTNAAKEISEATVKKVIKMRADGASWPEVIKDLGETNNFVHRVRPLMKKLDKSSVKPMGPGSPNYGKGKKK